MPSNENDANRETPFFRAARRSASNGERTGSNDSDANAETASINSRTSSSMHMLQQFAKLGLSGAALGQKAAVGSIKGAMPMFEFYSETTRAKEEELRADLEPGPLQKFGFSQGEVGVLQKTFGKAALEAIEISSVTHPVYEGAPAFAVHNPEGGINRPSMAHFLALGAAASAIWSDWNAEKPTPEEPEVEVYPEAKTVAYVAKEPGEFQYISTPLQPNEIRSFAMRQRSLNPPQQAMLLSSTNPRSLAPATEARMMTVSAPMVSENAVAGTVAPMTLSHSNKAGHGCSCGCKVSSSCSCGSASSGGRTFSPARYDENGDCSPIGDISCETRWRVRECFKVAFCDFLRCLGEQYCEAEEPDIGECLDDFLCSLLTCLPDAICPPKEPCEPCCPPKQLTDCHCNFAVGE